jgi:hypothetical protein
VVPNDPKDRKAHQERAERDVAIGGRVAPNDPKDREAHQEPRPFGGPPRDFSRLGATLHA